MKILLNFIDGTFVPDRDKKHIEITSKMILIIDVLGNTDFEEVNEISNLIKELQDLMHESPYRYQVMLIGSEPYCIDREGIIEGNFTTDIPSNVYLMLKSMYNQIAHNSTN